MYVVHTSFLCIVLVTRDFVYLLLNTKYRKKDKSTFDAVVSGVRG